MTTSPVPDFLERTQYLALRSELIEFFTRRSFDDALTSVRRSKSGCVLGAPKLPGDIGRGLLDELTGTPEWVSERWLRLRNGTTVKVPHARFIRSAASTRLASNDCIYHIPADHVHLRAFFSAVRSEDVLSHFSSAYGDPLQCQSFDVARLRHGQYLRRHSDDHEGRRFGLVFFLSPGWGEGRGGELVVEAPSGQCIAVAPKQWRIALIRISEGYQHNVCVIRSKSWVRYSIAAQFAAVGARMDGSS
ncbi:2OG-Fe(II) oxygenase [Streptomyces sp. NPDC051907]|uniref:2OG-Fe(II) oxygenase n=1 Tax=Streptomyces sp. NPDC051907 TaxID=3155284 RepID=UPI00341CF69B